MKLLVVGANGYVGKAVASDLRETASVWHLARAGDKNFRYHLVGPNGSREGIPQLSDLVVALEPLGLNAVINLAGDTSKGNSFDEIERLVAANVNLTGILLELCRLLGGIRYLGTSTFSIFDDDGSVNPQTFYAATKKMSDDTCEFFVESRQVVAAAAVELFDVYGPEHHPHKIIPQMIRSLRSADTLQIHDDGRRVIRPIFVDDVVAAIRATLEDLLNREGEFLQFSAPGRQEITVVELFALLSAQIGVDDWESLLTVGLPSQVRLIQRAVPHYQIVPNWTAEISLEEGIRRTVSDAFGKREEFLSWSP